MVITSEEEKLLRDFYERNKVLIQKAVDVMLASANDASAIDGRVNWQVQN